MLKRKSSRTFLNLEHRMFMRYKLFAVLWIPLATHLTNMRMNCAEKSSTPHPTTINSTTYSFAKMIIDRHFKSERVLARSNLFTAILLIIAANMNNPITRLIIISLAMLSYMSTWNLTSTIATAYISSEQFPRIRLFESNGWGLGLFIGIILNGWLFGYFSQKKNGAIVYNWEMIFSVTLVSSLIVLIFFTLLFNNEIHKNYATQTI